MDPEPSLLIFTTSIDGILIFKIVFFGILLCCSALISGAEVAFFSLSQTEVNEAEESDSARMRLVAKLLRNPKKLLATILVANNFINIATVLLFAAISDEFFAEIATPWIKLLIEIGVVTFLILLFGEILPKVYASRNKHKFSSMMAYPLSVLDKLFAPISLPMSFVSGLIQKNFGKQRSNLSVDQLSQALELTSEDETTKEEQKILQGIVSFGNTDTKQVMQPRMDVFALKEDMKFEVVLSEITKKGYSRIPVYKESLDEISGILYVKDLIPHIDKKSFAWTTLLRNAYFVPENKKLDDLLREFQDKKIHLAIVVDEYGGTSGLVSLEDVIEEIVGDISDEFDDEDVHYSKIDDRNYVFEGKTNLKDFYKIIGVEDNSEFEAHKGESETIAGFVLEIFRGFPKIKDKINFGNYTFTVEVIDNKRLKQVKVTRKE
ncbi:gliding motility-associated protein GldE [Kordia algicida OT-1]|uniref:Putative transmembrane CorC/HlyC family transporter associated protein n=1 Tax=Kordia algicida OT-1 TaxID=391587 RepID=A9DL75_9FLAO|nr:gliding motility-associated protein GldE [Kordia algicida]EDP98497.1 putative transmembrane CorC/HlyC family transporter associated protein [Kordia algicida OT-1]